MSAIIWRKAKRWKFAHAERPEQRWLGGGWYAVCGRLLTRYPPIAVEGDEPCPKCMTAIRVWREREQVKG